jgi:hypothetical protein
MTRSISVISVVQNVPREVSFYVADALRWPMDKKERAVKVVGCGMDMGLHLATSLLYKLYGDESACAHRWL